MKVTISQYLPYISDCSASINRYIVTLFKDQPGPFQANINVYSAKLIYVVSLVLLFFFVPFGSYRNQHALPPCLFFVKVEVGRKKKAEDVSDVKLLIFEADGVDAC